MVTDDVTQGLIGRRHPAAMLHAEITRSAASHGGLVLVTGEAGIGKTTLVTSAAEEARRLGSLVLSGACWDSESAPGYWPWTQVIRGIRRGVDAAEWASVREAAGDGLAALLGEDRPGFPALDQHALPGQDRHPVPGQDQHGLGGGARHPVPGQEQQGLAGGDPRGDTADDFRLYDAVTTALVTLSQERPVVVVLDDLHWADPASLRLLEFAAKHTWFERLLLVGTYRDVEAGQREQLIPLEAKATTITLTGLEPAEVGELVARTVGRDLDAGLVAEVHRRTGGNPFFVEQTARLWRSGGSITAVAPGVRDAVRRRLSLLPEPVAALLSDAAVLGAEFHRKVLAAMAAAPVPHVDRLLDEALAARLIVARGAGTFAFAHDLVRETLYSSVPDPQARHAAVVEAAGGSGDLADRLLPAELARHAHLAGDAVAPDRAIDLLLSAAADASRRFAGDEARGHLLRAYELSPGVEPQRRAKIALDVGQSVYGRDREMAWRAFDEAIEVARSLDDPVLLARVALSINSVHHVDPPCRVDLLREAHAKLVGTDQPQPLSPERHTADPHQPLSPERLTAESLSPERLTQDLAVHLAVHARRGHDDDALIFGLWAHHASIWGPGTAAQRVALTDELLVLARRAGDLDNEHFAAALRWVALIELGDPRYLEQFHEYLEIGKRSAAPRIDLSSAIDQSIIDTLLGRFDEAQRLLDQVTARNDEHDVHTHFGFMCEHHQWALWLLQGRFDDLEQVHDALRGTPHPCAALIEGLTALQRGDADLEQLARLEELPHGEGTRALWLRFQAQLAAASRDPEHIEQVRAWLLPLRDEWAVSMYGWDISGPVSLWLALLDAAQERWAEAVEGFEAAHRSAELMQARPWSVEARSHLVGALAARGDAQAAEELAAEVRAEAETLGMTHIPQRLSAASRPAVPAAPVTVTGSVAGLVAGEFRQEGAVWTLSFGGRSIHLPDAKGLNDLHLLLSHPGADLSAVRLLDPAGGEVVVAAGRLGGDAVLDDEAKARYRRRLAELDEQIDLAVARDDDRRAAAFDEEREALLAELRATTGLDGRSRRLGDAAERARKTVTARIRDVLRKLDELHPELATHLRATISTGATCRYQPDHNQITWRL